MLSFRDDLVSITKLTKKSKSFLKFFKMNFYRDYDRIRKIYRKWMFRVEKGKFKGRYFNNLRKFKTVLSKKVRSIFAIFILIIVIILLSTILILGIMLHKEKEKSLPDSVLVQNTADAETIVKKYEVTVEYLEKTLKNISKLSTAELSYMGICSVEEGNIPFITQKGFSMLYKGTVKAGIDASKVRVSMTDSKVTVVIPRAKIQTIVINPSSIQFYDEKKALFNWTELSDATDGIKLAENDIRKQADTDEILKRADTQAENIVKGLLEDIVKEAEGGRRLEIVRE